MSQRSSPQKRLDATLSQMGLLSQSKSHDVSATSTTTPDAKFQGVSATSTDVPDVGIKKIAEKDGYVLFFDVQRKKIYLANRSQSKKVIAEARYSESLEAEFALLSNIKATSEEDKKRIIDLLQIHLGEKGACLLYTEKSTDVSIAKNYPKAPHSENMMVIPEKHSFAASVQLPEGLYFLSDKRDLLKKENLAVINEFLLKHSNWAKHEGPHGLTDELLAKRIQESDHTFVLMDSKGHCLGYVSYFDDEVAGYGYNFAVRTDVRGQGYGKYMISKVFEVIPEGQTLILFSAYEGPTQVQARGLYKKVGFQTPDEHPEILEHVAPINVPKVAGSAEPSVEHSAKRFSSL